MVIFTGGKSTAINSPRHLVIRHARRLAAAAREKKPSTIVLTATADDSSSDSDDEPLDPGYEQISSYWAPGLLAGVNHKINVTQDIVANGETLQLTAEQDFLVDAPQFNLPGGSVYSVYPPPGYSDDHRILPHIVLTDPHLPWERPGSSIAETSSVSGSDPSGLLRNKVPWLVVFSFSQDELRLQPTDLSGDTSIFQNTSFGTQQVTQSSTMAVSMSVNDVLAMTTGNTNVVSPITKTIVEPEDARSRGSSNASGDGTVGTEIGDFIFVQPDLFTSLFSSFDATGTRQVPANPDTTPYQFLSHVRKINPAGMAVAGVEDTAIFSIVIGNRTGPLTNALPTTMTVHLVSIEGVEAMTLPIAAKYVAMCSLHSWNYTVLPENTLNVYDAFVNLGGELDVLRAPPSVINELDTSDTIQKRIAARMNDGYTMLQYQVQTGESTVALYRGPFTPTYVAPLANLTQCSNSGIDLQIMDKDVGIMDITYSTAWQVGRSLALGDQAFVTALGRLRQAYNATATKAVKMQAVKEVHDSMIRSRSDVLGDLPTVVKSLGSIHLNHGKSDSHSNQPGFVPGPPHKRWRRPKLPPSQIPDLSLSAPAILDKFPAESLKAARRFAASTDGDVYNEINDPASTDWMTVLLWLVDRMFLAGVPAHYLIPDPSYLPQETIRFFSIDTNWVDALIDGALSLGNHQGTDLVRPAIKAAVNDYITNVDPTTGLKPQIPTYGFYLRSDLVSMFPDLRVQVLAAGAASSASGGSNSSTAPPDGAPLLRHEIVTDGVMLGFMDRVPGSADFSTLVFTQPPHQQRFAAADSVTTSEIAIDIRRQYTVDQATRDTDSQRHQAFSSSFVNPPTGDTPSLFIWDSVSGSGLNDLRILQPSQYAQQQLNVLTNNMPKQPNGSLYFDDTAPTSALLAMQLNDPVFNLTISTGASAALSTLSIPPGAENPDRTLKQLAPAPFNKVGNVTTGSTKVVDKSKPGKTQETSANDDPKNWKFVRPAGNKPRPSFMQLNLGPHVRSIPTTSTNPVPPVGDAPPAGVPTYTIQVYSYNAGLTPMVQLQNPNLAQDLIFSVAVNQDPSNQYKLVELDILVQLGDPPKSPGDTACLMQAYNGPGIAMLQNLRFNVVAQNVIQQGVKYLNLRLLPRSVNGWVEMTTVNEMGFLMSLAQVTETVQWKTQFDISATASYCSNSTVPDSSETFQVTDSNILVTIENSQYAPSSLS
ncbi:hypothetical protein FHETE_11297 [Fusarium heterosporum]|uniref:Uncharacterized protein n=1 Tax=Fusarium heterosporum TaxID=42747 RepID=A0A8H5SPB9_FUSHE|nr:hypothetical protein FHETE_11297 [Fusarium heterosporum]